MNDFDIRQDWKKIISVQAGGIICLPIFIIGHALAKTYGMSSAILVIVLGNFLLLGMSLITAATASFHRKSTAECALDVFGVHGKMFFSGAMVFSMMGWFALQLNIVTTNLAVYIQSDMTLLLNIILGLCITCLGIKGMRGLMTLSSLSVLFLVVTVGCSITFISDPLLVVLTPQPITVAGISLVLACAIAAVIDLPTFLRLAKTRKDSILAVCLLFGFVLPLVESVGVYLFMCSQSENIIELLAPNNSPVLWKAWVMFFLLLTGWTTNHANVYSATVSLKTLMPRMSDPLRAVLVGIGGTCLSCLNVLDNLTFVLNIIGLILGSMGAVMISHFATKQVGQQRKNGYAWVVGIIAGLSSSLGYSVLQIPVLDAFIAALITKIILGVIKDEKTVNVTS